MGLDEQSQIPFSASFPLPFRVLFLAGMGMLGWATNLHGLDLLGVDAVSAMELRAYDRSRLRSPLPDRHSGLAFNAGGHAGWHRASVYRLLRPYTLWCLLSWALFRYATRDHWVLVDMFRFIATVCGLGVIVVLVCPLDIFEKRMRDAFLHSARRCLFPAHDTPIYFADVIFADVFTSFAKVLGDVWLSIYMLLPGNSLLVLPSQGGWSRWILPTIMSVPYLVRLRQCVIEHRREDDEDRRHLLNALKYATSFPVIFLSAAQRLVVTDLVRDKGRAAIEESWHGEHPLFRLWLLAAGVNSAYSFWWDVTNDWGLDLLNPRSWKTRLDKSGPRPQHLRTPSATGDSTKARHPSGLRPRLLYPLPVYPLVIFWNFILRMTWSIKLSSHLHSRFEGGEVIFWLEIAELVRRWLWVFVRVEWEVVKREQDRESASRGYEVDEGVGLLPIEL